MIQSIVEGQGEAQAFPVLLRRLIPEFGCYVDVGGSPFRSKRTLIIREADFKRAVQIAALKPNACALLVLFDADDDCASTHVPGMLAWAREVVPAMPCGVVMARREYEAWFLAAIESLRGQRGIHPEAAYPQDPEQVGGAKRAVSLFMPPATPYSETADQPAFSAQFDLEMAYRWASSFRKLVRELCRLLEELGHKPVIPPDWSGEQA